jgi:hypothetical protein
MRRTLGAVSIAAGLALSSGAASASAATKPNPITVQTKTRGVGAHPILQWKPVDGATRYVLSVNAKRGAPYWSWTGDSTRVRFGGGPIDAPDQAGGAALTREMRWFVVAFDDTGTVLAASKPRAIAP